MRENILKAKSYAFALQMIKLYKYLTNNGEFIMSKQLLRSGTSVGAQVREAEYAQSKPDFIHKLSIAQKEINETIYWIELLTESQYIKSPDFMNIEENALELLKIITSSIKTAKRNHNTKK